MPTKTFKEWLEFNESLIAPEVYCDDTEVECGLSLIAWLREAYDLGKENGVNSVLSNNQSRVNEE